ncbi:hypothetical protein BDR06DRAFT_914253 [Suillus hirtellus]|nr:hypothetical protein BDR06DRAFT_914253 [Suillus hirtellus]
MDWEVAQWAKLRGPGSTAFTDLLMIEGVCGALGLSYKNSVELNKIIDTKIPSHRPRFVHHKACVAGETYDLFSRDILECVRALYGDPEHAQYLSFAPERHYADADKTQRLYHDLCTGEWWWATQDVLEQSKPGATIIPIIISSDKTQITLFRNKTAYPVYLTIGNLPKSIRRKPSRRGQILLAYLPTTRLTQITNKASRRRTLANLFHACMSRIVEPLKSAGVDGMVLMSGDGITRHCHPIFAAFVGDYPEQCLVTGTMNGDCPVCTCPHNELGKHPSQHELRDLDAILDTLELLGSPLYTQACHDLRIKPLQHPFWEDLPYLNIFQSITPDILHQLYQGVMKHMIGWVTEIVGAAEIDARVRRLPPNHSMRIFQKGITTLSRVSGVEHKQMSRFLLGLVVDVRLPGNASPARLVRATRSLLDFLYLAQFPVHSNSSIDALETMLDEFHANKGVFEDLGIRNNFNIPKLHFLQHYARSIKLFGTTDNFNTEATERLHIDFAKDAYAATNHKDEFWQMTKWLERKEKVLQHANFIMWRRNLIATNSNITVACPAELWQPPDLASLFHIKMTRHPSRKLVPFQEITSASSFGAIHFVPALARFIVQYNHPTLSFQQIEDRATNIHLPCDSVPVFHRIKFWNNEIHATETLDSVHAQPAVKNGEGRVVKAARFDTCLVQVRNVDMPPASIQDLRVAQVRVVFSLPQTVVKRYFNPQNPPPQHLAYVEWFSAFSPLPDTHSGLYKVRRLVRDGEHQVSIVPVSLISRSAHLLPKWGGAVPAEWMSLEVLDTCDTFFLNVFKDMYTYFNVG